MSNVQLITKKDIRELSVVGKSLEVIDWVLYDTLTVATGGTQTAFRFFQQSQGQAGVSLAQTNLEIPGQLPAGYKFVCQKIVLTPQTELSLTTAGVRNQVAISHRGSAQLFIGTRPYLQTPVQNLVGGALVGFAASATGGGLDIAYAASRTIINGEMEYSPVIPANFSFSLLIQYDAAPAISVNTTLAAQMVGKLIRPRQG